MAMRVTSWDADGLAQHLHSLLGSKGPQHYRSAAPKP
jgi:hypothetical protein